MYISAIAENLSTVALWRSPPLTMLQLWGYIRGRQGLMFDL